MNGRKWVCISGSKLTAKCVQTSLLVTGLGASVSPTTCEDGILDSDSSCTVSSDDFDGMLYARRGQDSCSAIGNCLNLLCVDLKLRSLQYILAQDFLHLLMQTVL